VLYNEVIGRIPERRNNMPAVAKQKDNRIKVKQFVTDTTGHKMAAVIDMHFSLVITSSGRYTFNMNERRCP
jgi:hypothetical protein